MSRATRVLTFLCALASLLTPALARADGGQRLTLGLGVIHLNNPSSTNFEIGAEYEYRFDALFGVGAFGNYVFSNPSVTLLGFPEFFFHPLGGDFLVDASPIVEFGSGLPTYFGARLGTRIPIPLGLVTIIPSFAVDFIAGGQDYIFGLGLSF